LFSQKTINVTDSKGLKQGYWVKLNPKTNKIIYRGQFKDNKPFGVFKYYFEETDTIKTLMEFKNEGKTAYAQIFHLNNSIQAKGKYTNEKKDSVWMFYDEYGKKLCSENYKNGLKEGKSIIYYPDGNVLEEGTYKNDKKHGAFKQLYPDKKIKMECSYKDGVMIGKNAFYYPNGMLANIGYFNDKGNKFGVWLSKDKEGKVTEREVYDDGVLLEGKAAEEWLEKNKSTNKVNSEK
jgi:antitoxin component YwqK of YwqJK toxin-antitoxin module